MVRKIAIASGIALLAAGCLVTSVSSAAGTLKKHPPPEAEPEPASASDATPDPDAESASKEKPTDDGASVKGAAGSTATDASSDANADAAAGNSPAELPGKTYRFVGARYRGIVVPKFMENLFASGGRTVYVHSFGPEFAIRKDGFEYNLSAWLAFYSLKDTGFKGASDPDPAWEIISANMQILYLTSDFLWSHEFSPEFALNYGLGAGFGFVFGNLNRTQSFPTAPGQNPNDYSKCSGPGDPRDLNQPPYCGNDNNHYNGYKEASWAGGGSKPILFPWLTLQTGLRFKPTHSFAARLDLGFGTSGFFFGLGGDYGL